MEFDIGILDTVDEETMLLSDAVGKIGYNNKHQLQEKLENCGMAEITLAEGKRRKKEVLFLFKRTNTQIYDAVSKALNHERSDEKPQATRVRAVEPAGKMSQKDDWPRPSPSRKKLTVKFALTGEICTLLEKVYGICLQDIVFQMPKDYEHRIIQLRSNLQLLAETLNQTSGAVKAGLVMLMTDEKICMKAPIPGIAQPVMSREENELLAEYIVLLSQIDEKTIAIENAMGKAKAGFYRMKDIQEKLNPSGSRPKVDFHYPVITL